MVANVYKQFKIVKLMDILVKMIPLIIYNVIIVMQIIIKQMIKKNVIKIY